MRFYSKLVTICNICFLIFLGMRFFEGHMRAHGNPNAVIPMPVVEATISVIGWLFSIFLNAAFVFIILFRKSIRRPINVSAAMIVFNMLILPVQIWYLFFYHTGQAFA